MRTTMIIEFRKRKKPEIEAEMKHYNPKPIRFGCKSYGQGENTLTDHRSQNRIDNRRMQGKHQACKTCSGRGKGNPCPII